jgi:mediator of RNA polymerase II transcription subunit 5
LICIAILDSVLVLFGMYPREPVLQSYLKEAVSSGILSLHVFVTTFLQAAHARLDAAALDMLCRIAIEAHYSSNIPILSPAALASERPDAVLVTIQDALFVLQTAYSLPATHFHHFMDSSGELFILLANSFTPLKEMSSGLALACAGEARNFYDQFQHLLPPAVGLALHHLLQGLTLFSNDDITLLRGPQLAQSTLGKDILSPNEGNEVVTCSLLLYSLVGYRILRALQLQT